MKRNRFRVLRSFCNVYVHFYCVVSLHSNPLLFRFGWCLRKQSESVVGNWDCVLLPLTPWSLDAFPCYVHQLSCLLNKKSIKRRSCKKGFFLRGIGNITDLHVFCNAIVFFCKRYYPVPGLTNKCIGDARLPRLDVGLGCVGGTEGGAGKGTAELFTLTSESVIKSIFAWVSLDW